MAKTRRQYAGGAVATTIGSSLGASGVTTFSIAAATGWGTTAGVPFYVVVSPQTSSEEKMLVTISGTTLTVVARGVDGTTAQTHSSGAAIYPVVTAVDLDEANELTSKFASQGSLVYQGASTFGELAIGTAGHVLKVNSGATAPEWGQVNTTGIADTSITLAKLATALQAFLVPVGTITAYAGATAPTGWLLCDGTTSTSGYTALAALVGATTPDLKGKFLMGKTSSGTGSSLLGSGGSTTISEANLPSHTHSIAHDHAAGGTHSHTVSGVSIYDGGTSGNWGLIATNQTGNLNAYVSSTVTSPTQTSTVDLANYTGNSDGGTGSGTAYFQPFVAVSYIIKHD